MSSYRIPGPQCRFRLFDENDDGTLCLSASRPPGPCNLSLWPELHDPGFIPAALGISTAITDADKSEFEIIKKMPVMTSKHRIYKNVSHYVSDRTLYFGSPSAYSLFAVESDAELANTKWVRKKSIRTLSSMIEFNGSPKKQQIFYRWVRKAYKKKYGDDVNVPELIRKGMSKELSDKLADVRATLHVKKAKDEDFRAGGFNPRPVKYNHHYLLGTLSEHGTGMAVDIDDTKNAQLTTGDWKFIEKLVGKQISRFGRWDTEENAEKLWKDINEINDLFVKKVASEVRRIEKERADKAKAEKEKAEAAKGSPDAERNSAAKPHPAKPEKIKSPLQEVLVDHYESLAPWATSGFFHLPLNLVLEFHAHGFTWGATFSTNVDLHHFELDKIAD